jgi:hypothetical protein
MYMDYGIKIINLKMVDQIEPELTFKEGYEPYYNPHALCNESYGSKPKHSYSDKMMRTHSWPRADDDDEEQVEWTREDWQECLKNEADTLIECFIPEGEW